MADPMGMVPENAFSNVLLDTSDGQISGYELTGASAGPTILVAGISPLVEAVFNRLTALPTLPWMSGKIRLQILSECDRDVAMPDEIVDEVLYLPGLVVPDLSEEAIKDGYLAVLRLCTRLGMIAGRGVKKQ